jgi:hypothetical protein
MQVVCLTRQFYGAMGGAKSLAADGRGACQDCDSLLARSSRVWRFCARPTFINDDCGGPRSAAPRNPCRPAERKQTKRRGRGAPREQRLAPAQGDRADLDKQFVEQASIEELSGEISAADDPDILRARRTAHCSVYRSHIRVSVGRDSSPLRLQSGEGEGAPSCGQGDRSSSAARACSWFESCERAQAPARARMISR